MPELSDVVFLLDCDNTLLDNDVLQDDLRDRLVRDVGAARAQDYWTGFEALRTDLGYADYLGALQRFRDPGTSDTRVLQLAAFLLDYPFADRPYPDALNTLRHLRSFGPTVILSDGDVVFQPWKLQRSGLWDAVDGRVLIYVHKERMLDAVEAAYPARHYVMIDDKMAILAAVKRVWQRRCTTIFPRQGHYARDPLQISATPPADIMVERISDLIRYPRAELSRGDQPG